MTYAEKLRDPRWQKKRLEILNRDNFTCQCCGDKDSTLVIHHKVYAGDPWQVTKDNLITYCDHCHNIFESWLKESKNEILRFGDIKICEDGFGRYLISLTHKKLSNPILSVFDPIKGICFFHVGCPDDIINVFSNYMKHG